MFLGSKASPVCEADNLTAICEPIVGSVTFHNLTGLMSRKLSLPIAGFENVFLAYFGTEVS
jgi:hypothetical protein